MKDFTKILKLNSNQIEKAMWGLLRDRRFSGYKFRRQVKIGPYIVDFLCYRKRLIIELDGSQHNEAKHRAYDQKRTDYLERQKFKVIRFWNNEVIINKKEVLEKILLELLGA